MWSRLLISGTEAYSSGILICMQFMALCVGTGLLLRNYRFSFITVLYRSVYMFSLAVICISFVAVICISFGQPLVLEFLLGIWQAFPSSLSSLVVRTGLLLGTLLVLMFVVATLTYLGPTPRLLNVLYNGILFIIKIIIVSDVRTSKVKSSLSWISSARYHGDI